MNRYFLYTWPASQQFVGDPDAILICPPEGDEMELDSAYMVPDPEGDYVRTGFPESQRYEGTPGVLESYERDVFVPAKIYNDNGNENSAA